MLILGDIMSWQQETRPASEGWYPKTCHTSEGWYPVLKSLYDNNWMPAFAGMTGLMNLPSLAGQPLGCSFF